MNGFFQALAAGEITWMTAPAWLLLALFAGVVGGAIGGLKVGGEALGGELAMMMGAFYGIFAALPGILLAIVILALLALT